MAELGFGVVADILLHLVPVTLVDADILTVRTDRHDTAQRPNLIQYLLESSAFFFKRLFCLQKNPPEK